MPPAWIIKTFQVAIESSLASNIVSIDIWDIFLSNRESWECCLCKVRRRQVWKGRPPASPVISRMEVTIKTLAMALYFVLNKHCPECSFLARGTSAACSRSSGVLCRPNPGLVMEQATSEEWFTE